MCAKFWPRCLAWDGHLTGVGVEQRLADSHRFALSRPPFGVGSGACGGTPLPTYSSAASPRKFSVSCLPRRRRRGHCGDVRVLVVEDDDAIAVPLSAGLEREGFSVMRAATAEVALQAQGAEVVLLDLGLPDLDGFELCRRL